MLRNELYAMDAGADELQIGNLTKINTVSPQQFKNPTIKLSMITVS